VLLEDVGLESFLTQELLSTLGAQNGGSLRVVMEEMVAYPREGGE
jgi:hypothetical protein